MTAGRALRVVLAAPGLLLPAARGGAQAAARAAAPGIAARAAPPAAAWPAPLDRRVSLRVRDVTLRTALDQLAVAARVRLSYSAETLPLDRTVTVALADQPLGAALAQVLGGAPVEPVVVGAEQVVLAPARGGAAAPPAVAGPAPRVAVLDQVVVTGSAAGASERALPFALNVVRTARGDGALSVARGIDGAVPGIWAWTQSPSSLLARYGSIRGASSFGLTAPKVYVDGVEVANPLLVTTLAPESIDRVEVIRGPQGAAFYGADAISGVINIVTRHDGATDGGRQLDLRGGVGATGSAFADRPALTQDHGASLRLGSGTGALGVAASATTVGAYVPGAAARHLFADVYGRRVGSRWALSGTAYIDAARANTAPNPLVAGGATTPGPGSATTAPLAARTLPAQTVSQYTLGGTATHADGGRWTHVLTAGANGYRLAGLAVDPVAAPSAVDSALRAARGAADRGTMRASSVGRFGADGGAPVATTVTLAADWAVLRDATAASTTASRSESWLQTAGLSAQGTVAWRDALFVTAGLRGERNDGYAAASRFAALPMFGATLVRGGPDATVKLRTAYGRGLRPARTETRITNWRGVGAGAHVPDLSPEEQSGVEAGLDLFVGRAIAMHATAFDQRATGLIQQVAVVTQSSVPNGGPPAPPGQQGQQGQPGMDTTVGGRGQQRPRITYALQNVGVIDNRGVELEASWRGGPFGVTGTFTRVDSRVRRLARGYSGDLRPGDRMLEVPARTAGLDASWTGRRWTTALGVARAFDWTNYDRLTLAQAYASTSRQPRDLVGAPLRAYWRTYPGVTHLRASVGRDVSPGFGVVLSGDNLLDRQRGEPDNATVLPGRTVTLGVRARF